MITNDTSQAGQARFVDAVLNGERDGCFVDVGCSHPIELSNTYPLEKELGWTGFLFDSSQASIDLCRELRPGALSHCCDVRSFDFRPVLETFPPVIGYCSIDVDEHQVDALRNLLHCADAAGTRFRVMTAETDRYRFGDRPREEIIRMLDDRRYELIADDVLSRGCAFETWWVDVDLVDIERARRFQSVGLDWADILRKGGAL